MCQMRHGKLSDKCHEHCNTWEALRHDRPHCFVCHITGDVLVWAINASQCAIMRDEVMLTPFRPSPTLTSQGRHVHNRVNRGLRCRDRATSERTNTPDNEHGTLYRWMRRSSTSQLRRGAVRAAKALMCVHVAFVWTKAGGTGRIRRGLGGT